MKNPTFLIIGAAKCGTTSLAKELMKLSTLYLPEEKELHFFDSDFNYSRGIQSYQANFPKNDDRKMGEATPAYLAEYAKVIPRIKETIDHDLKFVVILRNPVDRSWSHFKHNQRARGSTLSFKESVELDRSRCHRVDEWENFYKDGLYAEQLDAWFSEFGKDNFLILWFDDLANNFDGVIRAVTTFLDVPYERKEWKVKHNAMSVSRSDLIRSLNNSHGTVRTIARMLFPRHLRQKIRRKIKQFNTRELDTHEIESISTKDRQYMLELYSQDIEQLEALLDVDLTSWK